MTKLKEYRNTHQNLNNIQDMINVEIYVKASNGKEDKFFTFIAQIHKAESINELKMDPDDFYRKHDFLNQIPDFPHHEIELITNVWDYKTSNQISFYHSESTKRYFVPKTKRLKTEKEAIEVFMLWGLATAYTIATNRDFSGVLNNFKASPETIEVLAGMGAVMVCDPVVKNC